MILILKLNEFFNIQEAGEFFQQFLNLSHQSCFVGVVFVTKDLYHLLQIWHLHVESTGIASLECAADLTRHSKPVNIVRFSPSGEYLASGDDGKCKILDTCYF